MSLQQLSRDDLVDLVFDLRDRVEELEAREDAEDLRQRLESQEALTRALMAQNKRFKTILAGSTDEFEAWNVDNMVSLHQRLEETEETLGDHAEKFEMFVVEDGKAATPDQRALDLRQVLLNISKQNDEGIGRLTREQAQTRLGGDLHRGTVLDAMRRAADGTEAKIDGASDLQPVGGIEFHTGGTVGRDGEPDQSFLELARSDLTGTEARQILTTGEDGREGSR